MARSCVFCGSQGQLTKEHVYPDWLSQLYGRPNGHSTLEDSNGALLRQWPVTVFQQSARIACARCNNGWMSVTEDAVKPFLGPMIVYGAKTTLNPSEQQDLATWAIKTALTVQFVHPAERHIVPQTAYRDFFNRRAQYGAAVVCLGYTGSLSGAADEPLARTWTEEITTIDLVNEDLREPILRASESGGRVIGVSMAIGHVTFHVVLNCLGGNIDIQPLRQFEVSISSPQTDLIWPSTTPTQDFANGLDGFMRVFKRPEDATARTP